MANIKYIYIYDTGYVFGVVSHDTGYVFGVVFHPKLSHKLCKTFSQTIFGHSHNVDSRWADLKSSVFVVWRKMLSLQYLAFLGYSRIVWKWLRSKSLHTKSRV